MNDKFKKQMRIIVIVAVIIVAIAIIALFIFKKGDTHISKSVAKMYDMSNPIAVKKDGKYGYIDRNGKMIIDPIYDKAEDFYGNYAYVKIENSNGDSLYQVINRKGEVQKSSESEMEYVKEKDVWVIDEVLYDGSLKRISNPGVEVEHRGEGYFCWSNDKKRTAGIMTSTGKITYTYRSSDDDLEYLTFDVEESDDVGKDKYCLVTIDSFDKNKIVNCDTGKVVYENEERYISVMPDNRFRIYDDDHNLSSVLYIEDDKIAYQAKDEDITLYIVGGYLELYKGGNKSYYNIKTKEKTDTEPDPIDRFEIETGNRVFTCDNGKGLKKGDKVILDCKWENFKFFDNPLYQYLKSQGKDYILAIGKENEYIIDIATGEEVFQFNWYIFGTEPFLSYRDSSGKYGVYNYITEKSKTYGTNDRMSCSNNYCVMNKGNQLDYYNSDLELIYTGEA